MSGKNPFWNYDYNAAQRNREIVDSYQQANEARLDSQQAQFEASMANDRVSRIQVQLNNTINSHKKVIADYEQRLEEQKTISFKLIMKVNIFERTLNRLQEQWPEKKESILDEIQHQKDYCSVEEYKEKWWKWVNDGGLTPEANCLKFPYPECEIKNKT
ncbi:hypothetical protein [Escherichia albertii]|uniref:hypothetical protein n=1 Tax=Escherichia albertii TaxID=208962 RepID=UPI0010F883C4|nr:hypothetical protein [Escherichia albertii]EFF0785337.1 hypothetical protein [Escherichia albertii]MCZ8654716.1 hypothetical protein [Escherichia albertii]WDB32543.1 hypothetical protein PS032_15305 [Escherichia albertii]